MRPVVIIRYSEIHLKGKNRRFFENLFQKNLAHALDGFHCELTHTNGRYLVRNFEESDAKGILDRVRNVFGTYSVSLGWETANNLDAITQAVLAVAPTSGTFRVETNRADKSFPMKSFEISAELGGRILDAIPSLRVDLHHPAHTVYVDMRENGETFVYSSILSGVGGMPVGSSGQGLVLLSGGIDSPVAGYLMAKRGMTLRALHFHSYPYTSEQAKEKVVELARILKKYCIHLEMDIVSLTEIQTEIHRHCPDSLQITILRRFMMRIAERIAKATNCGAIITGESLGQVASQTLESLTTSNAVVNMPVFRPLIGLDKQEIIEYANRIGTFETSILPFEDCCTVFLPKQPAIHPNLKQVEKFESVLDVASLIKQALEVKESIRIN